LIKKGEGTMNLRKLIFWIILALLVLLTIDVYSQGNTKKGTFTFVGVLVNEQDEPLINKEVLAYPVKSDGELSVFLYIDKDGHLVPLGFTDKTNSKGEFTIVIPRNYKLDEELISKWAFALADKLVHLTSNGSNVVVELNDTTNVGDLGMIIVR
jgi:hypothetical protein